MSDLSQLYSDKNAHSIGDMLKTRREELGLSLEEVSQRSRIRQVFLKALEEGRIDQLPGVAYAAGFLKAYAELLKLDSEVLVKRFRQENQTNTEKPKLMFPAPVPQSGIPAGVIIFFSLIIMVGAYIGWYQISDHHQSPSEIIPPAPTQADQKGGGAQQMSPQIASIMPSDHPALSPQDNKPVDAHANTTTTPLTEALQSATPSVEQPQSTLPQSVTQTDPSNNNIKPVEQKKTEQPLLIKAIAPSWLQIKDKDGKVLYQKVLKTDETWQVPSDKEEVVMTIGNPGVVVLQKGEIQSAPLGKKGRTLRRFVLDTPKADKLLHPEDSTTDQPSTLPTAELTGQEKKKNIKPKPAVVSKHDLSADELNARQLNR